MFNLHNVVISESWSSQDMINYVKLSTAIFNFSIITTLILIIINFIIELFLNKLNKLNIIIKYINMMVISSNAVFLLFKFVISLKLESILGFNLIDLRYEFFNQNKHLNQLEHFVIFSSAFSDGIILLSYVTGITCLELLGPKNLLKNISNLIIFLAFNLLVTIMASSNNLIIMFICFELLFLPTMYFAYKMGYSKKADKATKTLLYWTLFGSFLVLCCLIYINYIHNTLNYIFLIRKKFTNTEIQCLFTFILIGFAIKIPLAPLHYWLLRVHVESPVAFSIFLSGFLVKSALYCLFMIITIFDTKQFHNTLILWAVYSLIIGTLGLGRQLDVKKLIAWATIQEMSFMLVFFIFKQSFLLHTFVLFVILHGLMSTYMFYLVDIIQRRYNSRLLQHIKGLHLVLPKLTKHIWFLILLFSGFPLSAKFILEWYLISLSIELNAFISLTIVLTVNFIGVLYFSKILFTMLYGVIDNTRDISAFNDIQKKEYTLLSFLCFYITCLLFLIYYF